MPVTERTLDVDDRELAAMRTPLDDLMLEEADGPDRWRCAEGPFSHYERSLSVEPTEPGHCVFEVEVEAPSGEIVTAAAHVVVLAPAGAPRGCGCAGGSGGYGPVGLILALLVACGSRRRSLSSP